MSLFMGLSVGSTLSATIKFVRPLTSPPAPPGFQPKGVWLLLAPRFVMFLDKKWQVFLICFDLLQLGSRLNSSNASRWSIGKIFQMYVHTRVHSGERLHQASAIVCKRQETIVFCFIKGKRTPWLCKTGLTGCACQHGIFKHAASLSATSVLTF